ncbi:MULTISPECIES: RidA family protein [Hyphobacterium]|uniref:RidA family protein n=1 Tax=Hyphobacterium vulgare TaxID=1736751 RepID=A0ABV6ZU19_9PROT
MSDFRRAFSGAPWEAKVGYCRAVRAGPHVWVTGTVALNDDGSVHAPGDAGAQAARCFEIIGKALESVGAGLSDVVRTRMFVTDISRWEEIGAAHGAVFRDHPPATTMVEVSRFIGPDFLVEIEADAFVAEG